MRIEDLVADLENVEYFICWLIDHCERDTITEEGLQRAYASFLVWYREHKEATPLKPSCSMTVNDLNLDYYKVDIKLLFPLKEG